MKKFFLLFAIALAAPSVALAQSAGDLFAEQPDCVPVKYEWAKQSYPNHFCKTDTFTMKHGERRVFNADGEATSKGFIRSGFAALSCEKGKLILTDSSCSGPKTANEILAAEELNSGVGKLKEEDLVSPVKSIETANPASAERKSVADEINKLSPITGSFEDSTFRQARRVAEAAASVGRYGGSGLAAAGVSGRVLTTILDGDVAKVVLTVRAKFGDVAASTTKYVDHEVCVGTTCRTVRTSVSSGFGGGSGYYWGYDQWSEKIHTIEISGKSQDRLAVTAVASSYLMESDIRVDMVSPTAVAASTGRNLFAPAVQGKALCGMAVVFSGTRSSANSCSFTYNFSPLHSSTVSICPATPEKESSNFNVCTGRFCSTVRPCVTVSDVDYLKQKWFCPPGLTQEVVENVILCRAGTASN